MAADDEVRAIGWDAITNALTAIYGNQEPKHYGPILPAMLGGNEPLQGISVYWALEPLPHFHYVTYGFSELYEKESDDPEVSGFGFELTLRLACDRNDEEPPGWALSFLQNIARYVFSTGNPLGEHHHVDLNGPIALDEETEIGFIALAKDPQLGEIGTENGRVTFLQVVGLWGDEYELVKDWDCGQMLEQIGRRWPLLITDLKRQSVLAEPALAAEIRAKAEQEGSSQSETFVSVAEWEVQGTVLEIRLSATAARDVIKLMRSRLMHANPFVVYGKEQGVVFQPHDRDAWAIDEMMAVLSLSPETVKQMFVTLKPERGTYEWPRLPGVVVEIIPSEIKDQDGNVVEVIG
jgi:hypothetical protein